MSRSLCAGALALPLVLTAAEPAPSFARSPGDATSHSTPYRLAPQSYDVARRFDANDLDLWTTNFGPLAFDPSTGGPGLEFPRGSGKTAMFAAGLWVGAQVAGVKRVTISEYSSEWAPGRILAGAPEPVDATGLRSWKVVPVRGLYASDDTGFVAAASGDPVRHEGWGTYVAEGGAVGAPVGTVRLPVFANPADSVDVAGPDLPGGLALWSVFNDADPANHNTDAGGTPPLGLEVRQSVFGFGGELPGVAFVRWTLVHRGPVALDSAYVGFWSDPDIGGISDDVVAFTEWHGLGYAYNGQDTDAVYGSNPPAVGIQYLGSSQGAPLAAFAATINGSDPTSALESYRLLQGFDQFGNHVIDPTSGQPTRFAFAGDPLAGLGWIDRRPDDKRMLLSVGPIFLAPGDSATLTFALVAAQGVNRFDSIRHLQCVALAARQAYVQDFTGPFPPLGPECSFVAMCPGPAAMWATFCADSSGLPAGALADVARLVFERTRSIIPTQVDATAFCAAVAVPAAAPPRARAEREHLALLANLAAPYVGGIGSPAGKPVGLSGNEPVSCPWSGSTTVGRLAERAPEGTLLAADYVRVDGDSADYVPVDWGGVAYGGGVDFGSSFLGSSLDPVAQPDSFPAVEIRFAPATTQKAYRYLRLEQPDGSPPSGGREYRYGGYRDVPLEAIDVESGARLELAFVERALTDVAGTLLDSFLQPASFDSMWAPNADGDGGREYLFVLRRGYSGLARPEMEVDGVIIGFADLPPTLYAAWLHRSTEGDEPEPGEKLVIVPFATPPSPGADARLLALAALPQGDPAVLAGYDEIANCLAAINAGIDLGLECDVPTPVAITLEESTVEGGVVRLVWYAAGENAGPFEVARRPDASASWAVRARLSVDGARRVHFEDREVAAGQRWEYGLLDPRTPGRPLDVATITIPGAPAFALRVTAASGATPAALVFALPGRGEARLELFDAAGRRRADMSLGVLDAGVHVRPLPLGAAGPGLHFVRLTYAGRSAVARAVFLR